MKFAKYDALFKGRFFDGTATLFSIFVSGSDGKPGISIAYKDSVVKSGRWFRKKFQENANVLTIARRKI